MGDGGPLITRPPGRVARTMSANMAAGDVRCSSTPMAQTASYAPGAHQGARSRFAWPRPRRHHGQQSSDLGRRWLAGSPGGSSQTRSRRQAPDRPGVLCGQRARIRGGWRPVGDSHSPKRVCWPELERASTLKMMRHVDQETASHLLDEPDGGLAAHRTYGITHRNSAGEHH
jgi:hypothetical protein